MKKYFSLKLMAIAILAFFAMNVSSFAGDNYQAKIKTKVSSAVAKNKIETITNFLKGVESAEWDAKENNILIVKYDSEKINPNFIIHVLDIMDFDAKLEEEPVNLTYQLKK